MNFGYAVKAIRAEKGLTQKEVTELSGIAQTHLSQIEIGSKKRPSDESLQRLADAFEVPVVVFYLLALEDEELEGFSEEQDMLYNLLMPVLKKLLVLLCSDEDGNVPHTIQL